MGGSGPLISIHPEELTFQFELEKQCYCDLKLVNNTEHHVAFKVKTTSPKKYFVRPNTSIIQPWDSCVITVTLQAQREYPPDMQCRDKFLFQTTKEPPTSDIDEIPQDTFNKDGEKVIEECKLRVVYTMPAGAVHASSGASLLRMNSKQSSETASMRSSSSFDDVPALMRLKEERDSVLKDTRQMQQELGMLRRRRIRKNNAGFSMKFAAFVGLVGVVLGFLFNLLLS